MTTIICHFHALDDLPRRYRGSWRKVLNLLAETKRFSIFEVVESPTLGRTVDALLSRGYLNRIGGQYPWIDVAITEDGKEFLND